MLHHMSQNGEAQHNDAVGDFGKVTLGVGISHLGLVLWGPLGVFGNFFNCYIVITISAYHTTLVIISFELYNASKS